LTNSHRLNSKDQETLNYLAEAYYNLKDYQKSIDTYKKILTIDPYNTSIQNNLVFLYTHLKLDNELLEYYNNMMKFYPGDSKYAIQYALACIKQQKFVEAQRVLEKIVSEDSSQTNALLVLGNLYEAKKDTTQALTTYKNILTYDPTNEEILNRIYRIYRSKRQWEEIEKIYKPLISQFSNHSQARLILGETYYFQEKRAEAKTVIEPVTNDENFRPAAFELLGRIAFEDENYDEAQTYFNQLTQIFPQNRYGWIFLAVIHNRQEDFGTSIKILQNAVSIHPADPDLLGMYGTTLSELGRDQEALEPLNKALKIDKDNMATLSSIAAVYDKLNVWQKSDSLYQWALKKEPENSLLLNNYSYSLAQRGIHLKKALELVNLALEKDPVNGAYLDTKGWIYFKMEEYNLAIEFIKQALDYREESSEVLEHLGDVYQKVGQKDDAKYYWQKALEKDRENSELKQKIQNL
jgi:tetratricopeptide (TPR) repeat protein